MLGYLEINIEISDNGVETAWSSECRELSEIDKVANDMLATIQDKIRFSHKYG